MNMLIERSAMTRFIVVLFCIVCQLTFPILLKAATTLDERKDKIKSMETLVSPEALERKKRSELKLSAEGVPVNKFLPGIETEKEAKLRTKEEIAYRALALLVVALKGEGLEQPLVENLIKEYALEQHLTPKEQSFIKNIHPSEHEKVQFLWRYEASWTLLWALGYVEKLDKPENICDVPRAVKFMHERKLERFLAEAKVRSLPEILDQADRIYRYNWAVVDARLKGKSAPANLDPDVVQERHYALNWLIGYMGQDWDDINTDT